jgi:hypothetical protein
MAGDMIQDRILDLVPEVEVRGENAAAIDPRGDVRDLAAEVLVVRTGVTGMNTTDAIADLIHATDEEIETTTTTIDMIARDIVTTSFVTKLTRKMLRKDTV